MAPAPHRSRRPALALATGLALGLLGPLGPLAGPALAGPAAADPPAPAPVAARGDGTKDPIDSKPRRADRLGRHDRQLLARAQAKGEREVTILLATGKGRADGVAERVEDLGGQVSYRNDRVGYVRASVPTAKVTRAAGLTGVLAVDLNESIPLPDPRVHGRGSAGAPGSARVPAPGPGTPEDNPYLPTGETGAVTFTRANPERDGRGVTIGILDSGVDLDHPALQTTSTGERKIVDWVTATDPVADGDRTWRPMLTSVTGPSFRYADSTWTAPAGTYRINVFAESITKGSDPDGDVNRDGDTTDSFGILYRESDNAIWVDVDGDRDFTDENPMRPYREKFQVGHFGTDDPGTPVREQLPFVVEFREDVDLSPAGRDGVADFVNIGIVEDAHGSHVAGIAAGNDLFGGRVDGAAPGARLVSSRACTWGGGCTAAALTEGMIDLVVNRRVDVVNMSIGGLPALNDGNNARATLYDRLISDFGVQLFISAGNSGPGINTVGDPSVASKVVSVGASISRDTWAADYGSQVTRERALFNFSSRGPREDGGFKPDVTAPGAAVSTVPLWQAGGPVAEAGYPLPPGYAMFNGTSMAAPQAAGAAALLLSASRGEELPVTPAQLRQALTSTADFLEDVPAYAQGMGQVDVPGAWRLLRQVAAASLAPQEYEVSAPVCTPLSGFLAAPGRGPGLYNRCAAAEGGHAPGQARTYEVRVTRTSGPDGPRVHRLSWLGDDGTFSAPQTVTLPLGTPVTVRLAARPAVGAHGAVLRVDDPATPGLDARVLAVVVAGAELGRPSYAWSAGGDVERNGTQTFFVTVPEGAEALQVNLSGIATGSQTRFIAFDPYGRPVESTSSLACYTNFSDARACNPVSRSYSRPLPGVWEIEVESRRTSPFLTNPFRLAAAAQGVRVEPETVVLERARAGVATPVSWTVTNAFGPVTVVPTGGPLGSARTERPTIANGVTASYTVEVPAGASSLEVAIGNPADPAADLDLTVLLGGVPVGSSADGDSEESVVLARPAAGTYTVQVDGYSVPSGSTAYDYRDVFYAGSLGSVAVPATPRSLPAGATATVSGTVTATAAPAAGRELFGEMRLRTTEGAVVGRGGVLVRRVSTG